jgi:hypothetical protein
VVSSDRASVIFLVAQSIPNRGYPFPTTRLMIPGPRRPILPSRAVIGRRIYQALAHVETTKVDS